MKTPILRRLLISIALTIMILAIQKPTNAMFNTAVDLSLTCIGGNDYLVTFVAYRDCNYINAPATTTIHFQCTGPPYMNFSTTIGQVPGGGQEVTQVCMTTTTKCYGGSLFGFQEFVYQGQVILPPCNSWIASWTNCCRNSPNTITSPSSSLVYIEVVLDNLNAPGSSSPVMTTTPVLVLFNAQPNCQNPGAVDPDGDSLAYALVTPFNSSRTTFVTFMPPHSATQPLPSNPAITMDSVTGELCISPTMNIVAVLAIRVQKWRKINGVQTLIGTIYRDMQVNVFTMTNNTPQLSGMDTTGTAGYDPGNTQFYKEVCAGSNVSFAIWGKDPDIYNSSAIGSPETFSLSWNQGIPSGSFSGFNQNTDSAHAVFTWNPTSNHIREAPYCFIAMIHDNACPYNGIRHYAYCVKVKGVVVDVGSDTAVCAGVPVSLQAQTQYQPPLFIWKVNGNTVGIPQPGNQFLLNTAGLSAGIHTVSVEVNNGALNLECPGHDEMQIEILPLPQPMLGNDTAIAASLAILLNAGAGFSSYQWSTGETTQQIIVDSTGTGLGTATYWVIVTDTFGCEGTDTILISYFSNPGIDDRAHEPAVSLSPNPSNGILEIQLHQFMPGEIMIELVDFEGKTISNARYNLTSDQKTLTLDFRNVANGMYVLRVSNSEASIAAKLIIHKQ